MPQPHDYFLREAVARVDRIQEALGSESAKGHVSAPDLMRACHGLVHCIRLSGATSALPLARTMDAAARALVAGDLVWGRDVERSFGDTLAAIRARLESAGGPAGFEGVGDLAGTWRALGVDDGDGDGAGAGSPGDVVDIGRVFDELPLEVVAYFRSQAAAVLDRARRLLGGDDEAASARDLLPVMTELRDLASTFSFVAVEELTDSAISLLGEGHAAGMRELIDVLHGVLVEVPGDGAGTAPAVPEADDAHASGDDDILPIDAFCYRGGAALRRALDLEATVRRAVTPDPEALSAAEEVFDLIRTVLSDEAGAEEE